MPDDNSHVSKTVEDLRRQVAFKISEARTALTGLNALETAFGLPLTDFAELAEIEPQAPLHASQGSPGQPKPLRPIHLRGGGASIRPDEFLGIEPMHAAKRYMAMIGHAVTFDEIADGIQRGGAAIHGAGWREKLETSLMRSPYEVVKVADKTYGLASFYSEEQLATLRGARRLKRQGAPKPKRKRASPKTMAKPSAKKSEPKAQKQSKAEDAEPQPPQSEPDGAEQVH